jgi:hypothetical protein
MTVAQLEKALRLANEAVCQHTGRGRSFNNAVVEIHLQEIAIGRCKFDYLGVKRRMGQHPLYTNTMHSEYQTPVWGSQR